ncbi:tyrosine--tRNA ligase [Candidatus Saccharibacteria bacterium]|nr:tyrosine--tRNA ligase [Candidatus Saccharibacteria bacterium]
MKLSEELIYRGFSAETTISNPMDLDNRKNKKFYWGADPSADSLTIGNLAALMMCACFVRHGYQPYLLVGGATGQIGDPKDNGERDLKPLEEVEHNKQCIKKQVEEVISNTTSRLAPARPSTEVVRQSSSQNEQQVAHSLDSSDGLLRGSGAHTAPVVADDLEVALPNHLDVTMVDNYDWFKDMKYLDFLREVGKAFSMTQLLDRQFVQNRIGEGGSGISYAEFSYTLIQGYDFLHLYREYGVDLQLCGADQYGNCTSGIHLIKRIEGGEADVWSTPLVIDPVTGRKFGKSEGNAIWLASSDNGGGNYTSIFDFYQFWLNQPDEAVEYLIKIYTLLEKEQIEEILTKHREHPEERIAQKALARGATEVVHGKNAADAIENLTTVLFNRETNFAEFSEDELLEFAKYLPVEKRGKQLADILVKNGFAESKKKAREFILQGAITVNGEKVKEDITVNQTAMVKKGKNKFLVVK